MTDFIEKLVLSLFLGVLSGMGLIAAFVIGIKWYQLLAGWLVI
jgi:hypothetical protein